jgi:pSer/pThr/pTyr-binding forkhead associated (FHA) protein
MSESSEDHVRLYLNIFQINDKRQRVGDPVKWLIPPAPNMEYVFGRRNGECSVLLPGESVSRQHFMVVVRADGVFIQDMKSANGTWLNGERIRTGFRLVVEELLFRIKPGDVINVGYTEFVVCLEEDTGDSQINIEYN